MLAYPPPMPDQALELSFDAASASAVEAQWTALQAADVPSQADHRSMTNAPHLTIVAAVDIAADVVAAARGEMARLLPARIEVRGLVMFGQGPRLTIAHLVEPDRALAEIVERIRTRVPARRHPVWTPHVTLARRVPRRLLPVALEALASVPAPDVLVGDRLRWWDPGPGTIEDIASVPAG